MEQLTECQAIEFANNEGWKKLPLRERAELQMGQQLLCMPFTIFHEAVEKTLGRPVFTHEFGREGSKQIKAELFDGKEPATFDEIMELIPKEKRIVILIKNKGT